MFFFPEAGGYFIELANFEEANPLNTPEHIAGTKLVNAEEVINLFDELEDLVILDARTLSDYNEGHIPDAVHLVNTKTNEKSLAMVIANKHSPVVIYCNGVKCGRSVVSAKIAAASGYTKIYWFRGGIEEWRAKSYPIED